MTLNRYNDQRTYAGDDPALRCTHGNGLCGNRHADGTGLCRYHQAVAGHLAGHEHAPAAGCWLCPEPGSALSRAQTERLAKLAGLVDGWYDDGSLKPTPAALAAARDFLTRVPFGRAHQVWIGPVDDGSLSGEDSAVESEWLAFDITPAGRFALFSPLDPVDEADPATDDGLMFDDAAAIWTYLHTQYARLATDSAAHDSVS